VTNNARTPIMWLDLVGGGSPTLLLEWALAVEDEGHAAVLEAQGVIALGPVAASVQTYYAEQLPAHEAADRRRLLDECASADAGRLEALEELLCAVGAECCDAEGHVVIASGSLAETLALVDLRLPAFGALVRRDLAIDAAAVELAVLGYVSAPALCTRAAARLSSARSTIDALRRRGVAP